MTFKKMSLYQALFIAYRPFCSCFYVPTMIQEESQVLNFCHTLTNALTPPPSSLGSLQILGIWELQSLAAAPPSTPKTPVCFATLFPYLSSCTFQVSCDTFVCLTTFCQAILVVLFPLLPIGSGWIWPWPWPCLPCVIANRLLARPWFCLPYWTGLSHCLINVLPAFTSCLLPPPWQFL